MTAQVKVGSSCSIPGCPGAAWLPPGRALGVPLTPCPPSAPPHGLSGCPRPRPCPSLVPTATPAEEAGSAPQSSPLEGHGLLKPDPHRAQPAPSQPRPGATAGLGRGGGRQAALPPRQQGAASRRGRAARSVPLSRAVRRRGWRPASRGRQSCAAAPARARAGRKSSAEGAVWAPASSLYDWWGRGHDPEVDRPCCRVTPGAVPGRRRRRLWGPPKGSGFCEGPGAPPRTLFPVLPGECDAAGPRGASAGSTSARDPGGERVLGAALGRLAMGWARPRGPPVPPHQGERPLALREPVIPGAPLDSLSHSGPGWAVEDGGLWGQERRGRRRPMCPSGREKLTRIPHFVTSL